MQNFSINSIKEEPFQKNRNATVWGSEDWIFFLQKFDQNWPWFGSRAIKSENENKRSRFSKSQLERKKNVFLWWSLYFEIRNELNLVGFKGLGIFSLSFEFRNNDHLFHLKSAAKWVNLTEQVFMAEALSARCYRTLGGKFRNYRFFLKFENALNQFGNAFIGIFCHYCN